jgi:hypothetical protein
VYGLDSFGLRSGPVAGFCEHGNEHSRFIKDEEFIEYLSDYQVMKQFVLQS